MGANRFVVGKRSLELVSGGIQRSITKLTCSEQCSGQGQVRGMERAEETEQLLEDQERKVATDTSQDSEHPYGPVEKSPIYRGAREGAGDFLWQHPEAGHESRGRDAWVSGFACLPSMYNRRMRVEESRGLIQGGFCVNCERVAGSRRQQCQEMVGKLKRAEWLLGAQYIHKQVQS